MSTIYDDHNHNDKDDTSLVQVPSGKGENKFAFGGEVQDKQLAQQVTKPDKWQLLLSVVILSMTSIMVGVNNSDDGSGAISYL